MATALEEKLYDAVRYTLDRAQTDPEFRWHMLQTEAHYRLIRAEAAFTGRAEEEVREQRQVDRQPSYRSREPECALNKDRVSDLERLLRDNGIDCPGMR
jgi:hypothetical protein